MTKTGSKIHPRALKYLDQVESGEIRACKAQHAFVALVKKCFETEDIYIDEDQFENYLSLSRYFPFDLFPWEETLLALVDCTYWLKTQEPRWPTLLCVIGRGAGKDGFIGFESMCLTSPYNGIRGYDIDICANNEEQAMRPVWDLLEVLEDPANNKKLKKHFYWNKEKVTGLKTKSTMRGRTNSPKGKDGLRSGKVVFNEIHQYENYENINVFTTGLGKKKHPRASYMTTQGDVREGPLDELLEDANGILFNGEADNGLLPFICRLDEKDEVHDEENWQMANPSLPYLPNLMAETRREYAEWKKNPQRLPAFMTKRMNLPQSNADTAVTDYENIKATKNPLPDLSGWSCTCGIDFVKVGDFASVNLHFKKGDQRYDINKSWLCTKSKDLSRIKAPWRDWEKLGLLTVVDDVEIHPDLICRYISEMGAIYHIEKIALDNYRYGFLSEYLDKIGFDAKVRKNVVLVRPADIMRTVPVIDSCFNNNYFSWGDNPVLRWATNNTKLVRSSRNVGSDTGNFYYAKIEAKSRKTDPFMALVASMVIEAELDRSLLISAEDMQKIPVFTF